ncbi:hypothetical protein G6F58_012978 [Rhizopus delemar]|nr:hypothetical protein G6F58_012978 [Rhizopus delemar]
MSVGVFPIQSGKAEQVAADLEKVFGEESKTPSAGMCATWTRSSSGWTASTPPVAAPACSPMNCATSRRATWPNVSVKPSPAAATATAPARHRWHPARFRPSWAATATVAWTAATAAATAARPPAAAPGAATTAA